MPDPDLQIITCPECLTEFKVPGNGETPGETSCPMCGIITSSPQETTPSGNIEGGSAIPLRKKTLNIDLPDMIIRNANQKNHGVDRAKGSSFGLKHINQKFKVTDTDTPTVEKSSIRRSVKHPIGWKTDVKEENPSQPALEASDPNAKSRFKMVSRKKKYSVKALLLFVLAILCMITALWMRSGSREDKQRSEVSPIGNPAKNIPPTGEPVKEDTAPIRESAVLTPMRQAVKDHGIREINERAAVALRTFLEAGELSVRKTVTRAITRVEPLMMDYYTSNDPGPIKYQSISDYSHSLVTEEFCLIEVILHDLRKVTAVVALEQGDFVVDWESFVGYSEMSLSQFMKEQPRQPTLFRVRIKFDDYFNFDFNDKTHICLRLSDLNQTNVIYGYIKRKSELLPKLRQGREGLSIVRIRYPEHPKSSNQVLIEEVITNGWVLR
jgi:hypothetical protein